MKKIVAAGFNPAWQKVITFEKIVCGNVNRASGLEEFASGKGINFCRAVKCYDRASAHLIQFCGGTNGERIEAALKKEGICFDSVKTAAGTRCCDTCIDLESGKTTELIEPSYPAAAEEVEQYVEKFSAHLNGAAAAAFCGTLPTGTDGRLYGRLAGIAAEKNVPLLVDAWKNVDDIFSSGAEIWLKINREELAALTGKAELKDGLMVLNSRWGIKKAAITDGPGAAFAFDCGKIVKYTLPVLTKIVNPIGCGDTASAVLCSGLVNGNNWFEAFARALGAASANCLSSLCGSFAKSDADRLASVVTYSEF